MIQALGHNTWWPATVTVAVTAALGLWRLGRPELWQDELVTIDIAVRPWRRILLLLHDVDAVHGTYYLFMHGWVQLFGTSAAAVRAPSALAMAAAGGCVALVGQRLFDHRAGLLGGLVFAAIPAVTRFAQESRSYAFTVLFAALATLALTCALRRPTALRWLGYAACLAGIALLNAVALAVVAGHGLGLLVWHGWRPPRRVLAGFAVAVTGGIGLACPVPLLGTTQATTQIIWVPHDPPWRVWQITFHSAPVAWAVLALAAVAWFNRRRPAAFATAVAVTPMVVVWLVSLGDLSFFFSKYLLFGLPVWAVLAGAGLAAARGWLPPLGALVVVVALAVPGQIAMRGPLSHSWYTYPEPRPRAPLAYADAAEIVAQGYRPGDGIVYPRGASWWLMHDVGVNYYLPARVQPRDIFLTSKGSALNTLYSLECFKSEVCLGAEPRLWVVLPERRDDALAGLNADQASTLAPHYAQVWARHPSGMTVALLERVN